MNNKISNECIEEIITKINSVSHWYHSIEIIPGIITPGMNNSKKALGRLGLPDDCTGLKVLDIGTRDGFFAFELEKRGADVTAIDYCPAEKTGFKVAAELLNSKVKFVNDNVYNLSKETYGEFDIVLFLGVLYHLPDPMLVLNKIRSVCKGSLYLESYVIDNEIMLQNGERIELKSISNELLNIPIMQFYPQDRLNNDFTNYWGPNSTCIELMLKENNFVVAEKKVYGNRGIFKCTIEKSEKNDYFNEIARNII